MIKKTSPSFLIFVLLLMVPLRVGAMDFVSEKKDEESKNNSARAAAVREHEREATEPNEDTEESFTSPAVHQSDSSGAMDGITRTPSFGTSGSEVPNNENTIPPQETSTAGSAVAVVTGNRRQQDQILRTSRGGASLQNLDPATQARLANIERVRSQASALVEKAKINNPKFAGIINEWHQSDDPGTRAAIINTQILAPSAPKAERAQRNEIADLLQRAAQMEESVAQMEQVGIDETWRDAEMIAPAKIVQGSPQRVRAEQALQALQRENQLHQQALDRFISLIKASKTMVCLKALDFSTIPMSPIADAFLTANQGADWASIPLILNNGESPVRLIIPASEGQSNYTLVTPPFIPAGARTIVNGVMTTAPRRAPNAEENRQVRTLIKEALQASYGSVVSDLFSNLDQVDTPLMASEISNIFAAIEEKHQENENQNEAVTAHAPQIPALLGDVDDLVENSVTKESDDAKRLEAQALFDKVHENLTSPNNALARAAWHAGETVVRSAGVVGGTIAGLSSKVGRGALVGAAIPATLVAGGIIGADAGAFVGNIVGLNAREADQAIIGSYLALAAVPFVPHASLLAAATAISGFGAVGGATPSVYHALPAAAERALNYYAPGVALEKTKEALHDWRNSSEMIARTLTLMQQAQETDLDAMEALHDFFENFVLVSNSAVADQTQRHLTSSSSSSSTAIAVEETKADGRAITPETLTPTRARDILMGQIKLRIRDRENLMMRLQNKMESIKAREQQAEQQARATFQSSDFRTRYPRGL